MSKRRFFIIGKGSGSIMRHLTVNVGGGHGSLLVNGELVTLNENNNYEGEFTDGTQITMEITTDSDHIMTAWHDTVGNITAWQSDDGWCNANPTTLTVSDDYTIGTQIDTYHNVTVVVDPSKYTLIVGGTTYTSNYIGRDVSGNCDNFEIIPETGYQFNSWGSAWNNNTTNPDDWCYYNDAVITPDVTAVAPVTQPNDELWYTTSNNQTVTPYSNSFGSRSILTNTYSDGKGIIKFDGNLVEIGYEAFKDCNTLTTVSFPDTVTNIGDHAFDGCHMSTLNLNHITSIGSEAFDLNDQTTLNIPQYVTSITDNPFRSEHGNLSITVDANNSKYTDGGGNNCVYDPLNNKLITGGPNTVIPSGCTTIGDWAFSECYGLTSIEIPASVTQINQFAFACDNTGALQELIVHSNPSLVHECFMNQATGGVLKYSNGVDPSSWLNKLPSGWTAIIVPPNDEIWYETSDNQTADFSNTNFNANITSNTYSNGKGVVKFDNNVTSTSDGYGSPSTATNLTKIWFPDSFTTVGNYSFMKCPLTYVSFNNITTIGYRAFDFNEITSLYIPPALSSIGNMGLRGKYLTNITVNPNNQTFNDGINDNGSNCICDTLNGTLVLGCVNTVIPDSCTEIGRWAFSSNKLLTTIDFKQATQINGWAADFDITELSGPALETIYVRSTTPATFENTDVFDNQKTNGILYYESGVDYQRWLDILPSGWTAQLIS